MLLVNLYRFCRKCFAEKTFHKNSILGDRANIQHTARCVNHGEKRQIVIGEHCEIKGGIFCYSGGKIQIGNHFYCGGFTYIHAAESITIGDCVILSNHIRIMDNNSHPVDPEKRWNMSVAGMEQADGSVSPLWDSMLSEHAPVIIEDNVWVGEFAAILKGVTVGKGSIIGSHSVVTKDVPPYSIAVGNPARIVRTITLRESTEN